MYDNLKQGIECSFDDSKCTEHKLEQNITQEPPKPKVDYAEKVRQLNNKRCNLYDFYKGSINYVNCMEAREGLYRANKLIYDDEETAYNMLKNEYEEHENICIRNGIDRKAKNFKACVISVEYEKLKAQKSKPSESTRSLSCYSFTDSLGTRTKCY